VPSVAEEDARRTDRERERLLKERTAHANRIMTLCALHGIRGLKPLRRDRRAQLAGAVTAAQTPLPARARAELMREVERLELVLCQLAEVERARDRAVHEPPPDDAGAAKAKELVRFAGIAETTGSRLGHEVFYRCFANRRQVASFVGLTPTPFASGRLRREQGITKAGNARARATMIELAHLWVRHQPDSALTRWFLARIAPATGPARRQAAGRIKRIAIVALARKLLVALWRYLETGVVPEGAVLKP
jgi:transposase